MMAAVAACGILEFAVAADVHKWVDENGVTHYSDEAPEAVETTLIDVPEPSAVRGSDHEDGYYSISRQWQRMHRERLEREKLEVERERLRAAQKSTAPPTVYVQESDEVRYVPVYGGHAYRKHRGHRRHIRPAPGQGIEPYRPATAVSGTFPTL
jgi:hypothetical protein